MPLDPYFTRDGASKFTCRGKPRIMRTADETRERDRLLALPGGERGKLNLDIVERLKMGERVSRAELFFHHAMHNRARAQRHLAPCLVRRDEADATFAEKQAHAHA